MPREGEEDGKTYHFLKNDVFDQAVSDDAFVEWCHVHQNRYGTLKSEIEEAVTHGRHALLEIDTQGARKVRPQYGRLVSVFISPPSFDELSRRLRGRNTESEDVIQRRLKGRS